MTTEPEKKFEDLTPDELRQKIDDIALDLEDIEEEDVANRLLETMAEYEDRLAELEGTAPPPELSEPEEEAADTSEDEADETEGDPTPRFDTDSNDFADLEPAELNKLCTRLRQAIVQIGKRVDPALRPIVDQYAPCATPASAGDTSRFPREYPVRPHQPLHSSNPSFGDTLCFLIGQAIKAYHQLETGEIQGWETKAINLISRLAESNPESFRVWGSPGKGFELLDPVEVKARIKQREAEAARIEKMKEKREQRKERSAKIAITKAKKAEPQPEGDDSE